MGHSIDVQVFRGGKLLAQQHFDAAAQRTIKIGRLASAQLTLDDPKVSRVHAVIELVGAEVSLIDLGSTGGTAVNGAKVHKVALHHGDELELGDTRIVVGFGGMPAQATGAAPPLATVSPIATPIVAASPTPRFDAGTSTPQPVVRIGRERLRAAAVESRPHPALPPEEPMRPDHRVLELRLYWGEVLLNVQHYSAPERITIGESKKTDVFLSSEGLPQEAFPLVRYVDGEYVLTFTREMEGEVEVGGELYHLQALFGSSLARRDDALEGSYCVTLPAAARAIVHWGGATFALRFVAPPKRIPNEPLKNLDYHYLNALIGSLSLHLAFVVTLLVYPYDAVALPGDRFDDPNRFVSIMLEPPTETPSTRDLLKKIQATVERKRQDVTPEPPEKTPTKRLKLAPKTPKSAQPPATPEERAKRVMQKFNKLLTGAGGGGPGSLLAGGAGGLQTGRLANVIGTAGRGSSSDTLFGFGIRGGVSLGGGVGTSRGFGGIGTSGRLGGGGPGYGSGVGLGQRRGHGIELQPEDMIRKDALPREVILAVIRKNQNQIRYCYEHELQKRQDLEGRVLMRWLIGAAGDVVKVEVKDSTLASEVVESCIAAKIMSWKFPAPAGGATVEVVYPWVLEAS